MRRSPRRSFISPSTRCATSRRCCADAAFRCGSSHADSSHRSQGRQGRPADPRREARHRDRPISTTGSGGSPASRGSTSSISTPRWASGSNDRLVREICQRLPCQVGGGVRSPERALELCAIGAKKVIVGSALFKDGRADRRERPAVHRSGRRRSRHRRRRQQGRARRDARMEERDRHDRRRRRPGRSSLTAASSCTRMWTRKA